MITMSTILYSLFAWTVFGIGLLIIAVPVAVFFFLPGRFLIDNSFFRLVAYIFYWICIRCSFLPITFKGKNNIPNEPALFIANHQSSFDIPLIGYMMGNRRHLWLAWAQLMKWPLLKFVLSRIALLIDLSSPLKASKSLLQTISLLKEKPWDVIIFPEGGRYTDGTLHPFYGGFALLAQKTERPVVPIKITGVQKVYPPNTIWIHYHPISVIVGKPFYMDKDESQEDFIKRIYQWYNTD